jgi:transposase
MSCKKYPSDQRERALRMAQERLHEYPSPWAAAQALGPKLGVGPETLRKWIVQAQIDGGDRPGPSSEELAEIKALKSQVRDLSEANESSRRPRFSSPGNPIRDVVRFTLNGKTRPLQVGDTCWS